MQGKLFVGEMNLAFRANVFGWETQLIIPWSEIVSIEKRFTAIVIPNSIEIATPHARHTFSSLLARDTTYALLVAVWRHHHPEAKRLRSQIDGQSIAETTKLEGSDTDTDNESIVFDDDHGQKKRFRFRQIIPDALKIRALRSREDTSNLSAAEAIKADAQAGDAGKVTVAVVTEEKGTHRATKYDGPEFDHVVLGSSSFLPVSLLTSVKLIILCRIHTDTAIFTSPEKVYQLIFKDSDFMSKFWVDDQKLTELSVGEWTKNADSLDTRLISYIRQLSGSIGPKQTKCLIEDVVSHVDFEEYVSDLTTTRTPDVPAGSSFAVQTRLVLTWTAAGGTRMKVSTNVEWSKVRTVSADFPSRWKHSFLSCQRLY